MTAFQTKRKFLIGAIFAASGVSIILTLLPYKLFTSIWIGATTPGVTRRILDHLTGALTGDYLDLAFLSIFFPVVILVQLAFLNRHPRIRMLMRIQGILLLCSAFAMQWSMTFYFLESHVKLLPTFYLALLWVGLAAVSSFLLMSPRIRHAFSRCGVRWSKSFAKDRDTGSRILHGVCWNQFGFL